MKAPSTLEKMSIDAAFQMLRHIEVQPEEKALKGSWNRMEQLLATMETIKAQKMSVKRKSHQKVAL